MHSSGINGEGEIRGNCLTQIHMEKWPMSNVIWIASHISSWRH